MSKTLAFCAWLLVVFGFCMSLWLCGHPWALLPYGLILLSAVAARALACRVVICGLALLFVVTGFSVLFDARFIHLSTLNLLPDAMILVQSALGATACVAITVVECRKEKQQRGF